ncbi:glycerate kinase [Nocardioides sp.]|uniref:glycerate kinase family protein n=1 Tax=Nocardioides sp. TaxID=35761 RepID=UPI00286BFAD4|nr:glycerate kinase [Nocardioides sp.]
MPMSVPQRILIAPSGFKESLTSEQVAEAIAQGVRRALPGVHLDLVPLVDGGEGTATTLATTTGGRLVPLTVTGPVGQPVESHLALLGSQATGTAVVEMAAAAGLHLVPRDQRDPGATTTYGVGELIRAALDHGATTILVGCGDSGTCDGGAGALVALGATVRDEHGEDVAPGGAALRHARTIDLSGLDERLSGVEVKVACNPHNVLLGESGVARVFGPQKGATPAQVDELETGLAQWAALLDQVGRHREAGTTDLRLGLGTGASGGLGAGLAAGLGAHLLPRFDVLLDHVDLDASVRAADLVITAEGAVDFQTPRGKIPAEVARRAQLHGRPVVALAGSLGEGSREVHGAGIDALASILTVPMPLEDALTEGATLLADAAERMMRMVLVGCSVAST